MPISELTKIFLKASLGHPNTGLIHLADDIHIFVDELNEEEGTRYTLEDMDTVLRDLECLLGDLDG